jgi:hypothetical protein
LEFALDVLKEMEIPSITQKCRSGKEYEEKRRRNKEPESHSLSNPSNI